MIRNENSAGDEIRGSRYAPEPARVDAGNQRMTSIASAGAVECEKSGGGVRFAGEASGRPPRRSGARPSRDGVWGHAAALDGCISCRLTSL